ncbi:hypothetical protein [Pseudoflavonifractor sp. 524-17]|uniref:hypothetical protein n=1 Tax=Pseudoflavonifractor sp. 524-17 TaxID=2304577 RepID=UPI00137AE7E0|nr:hypothetical protein [Pseudoflavonifractor sp. 524-17]
MKKEFLSRLYYACSDESPHYESGDNLGELYQRTADVDTADRLCPTKLYDIFVVFVTYVISFPQFLQKYPFSLPKYFPQYGHFQNLTRTTTISPSTITPIINNITRNISLFKIYASPKEIHNITHSKFCSASAVFIFLFLASPLSRSRRPTGDLPGCQYYAPSPAPPSFSQS